MAKDTVARVRSADHIARLLALPELRRFVADLESTRSTGRVGYGPRALVGMALVKAVYALPTWTRAVALVEDNPRLRRVLGGTPSLDACYRFTRRLREHANLLDRCLDDVVGRLVVCMPDYGVDIAVDGSDMPAYANGQRYLSKRGPLRDAFSDPDATWGHRSAVSTRSGGGYYGFKLHLAVCTRTGLPIAWTTRSAKDSEQHEVAGLIDVARGRGARVRTAALDKGYDVAPVYDALGARDVLPVVPLTRSVRVKRGEHLAPKCGHGRRVFNGATGGLTRWACPHSHCRDIALTPDRLHPLIPRETEEFTRLYRGRSAVEREFGRLKHEWGLAPLRVRRLARVHLHVSLVILARLASVLVAG